MKKIRASATPLHVRRSSRGVPIVQAEGSILKHGGFPKGTRYEPLVRNGALLMKRDPHGSRVVGGSEKRPCACFWGHWVDAAEMKVGDELKYRFFYVYGARTLRIEKVETP